MKALSLPRVLLLLGIVIIVVGLFYGANPYWSMGTLLGIPITDDQLHMFRAIMVLYLGVGSILVLASWRQSMLDFAIRLAVLFLATLALGRLLSFWLDPVVPLFALLAFIAEVAALIMLLVFAKPSERA